MGIDLAVSRLAAVWNDNIMPYFFKKYGSLSFGFWFGFGTCIYSVLAG